MRATLQRINGDPIMIVVPSQRNGKVLKKQILELVDKIYNGTEDINGPGLWKDLVPACISALLVLMPPLKQIYPVDQQGSIVV